MSRRKSRVEARKQNAAFMARNRRRGATSNQSSPSQHFRHRGPWHYAERYRRRGERMARQGLLRKGKSYRPGDARRKPRQPKVRSQDGHVRHMHMSGGYGY